MRRPGFSSLLLVVFLGSAAPVVGTEPEPLHVGPAVFHPSAPKAAAVIPSLDFASTQARLPASVRHALPGLTEAERARLRSRDARSELRKKVSALRVGLARTLPAEVGFSGIVPGGEPRALGGGWLERGAEGGWTWTASFSSAGADGLRVHVRAAWLPPGGRVFLYGSDGEAFGPYAFDEGTRPEGFWTNTVFAPDALLRVELPAADAASLARAHLAIASLVHLEHPVVAARAALSIQSDACFVDASCATTAEFPNLPSATHAVGQLNFLDGADEFICTGGLLNTTTSSFVPYLLTANHCFSTQPSATSLEIFWNYKTPSCGALEPPPNGFPRTLGSTLLATSETSDFTLVQLSVPPPAGSVFLGWTTGDYAHVDGAVIHRLSHPNARPQFYSRHEVVADPDIVCLGVPVGNFLYSQDVQGGTGPGSSGSPVYLESLEVVGQELGACGSNTDDDCDVVNNRTVDGAFRVTFPSISQWLAPATPGPCVPNAATLCLHGGRFRVTTTWTRTNGDTGSGTGVKLTDDSAYFWFFNSAQRRDRRESSGCLPQRPEILGLRGRADQRFGPDDRARHPHGGGADLRQSAGHRLRSAAGYEGLCLPLTRGTRRGASRSWGRRLRIAVESPARRRCWRVSCRTGSTCVG